MGTTASSEPREVGARWKGKKPSRSDYSQSTDNDRFENNHSSGGRNGRKEKEEKENDRGASNNKGGDGGDGDDNRRDYNGGDDVETGTKVENGNETPYEYLLSDNLSYSNEPAFFRSFERCTHPRHTRAFQGQWERPRTTGYQSDTKERHYCPVDDCSHVAAGMGGYRKLNTLVEHMWKKHEVWGFVQSVM